MLVHILFFDFVSKEFVSKELEEEKVSGRYGYENEVQKRNGGFSLTKIQRKLVQNASGQASNRHKQTNANNLV